MTVVSRSDRRLGRPPTLPPYVMSEDEVRDIPFSFKDLGGDSESCTLEVTGQWVRDRNNPKRFVFCQISNRQEAKEGGGYSYWPQFTDTVCTLPDGTRVSMRIQLTLDGFVQGEVRHQEAERKDLVGGQPDERAKAMLKATQDDDEKLSE